MNDGTEFSAEWYDVVPRTHLPVGVEIEFIAPSDEFGETVSGPWVKLDDNYNLSIPLADGSLIAAIADGAYTIAEDGFAVPENANLEVLHRHRRQLRLGCVRIVIAEQPYVCVVKADHLSWLYNVVRKCGHQEPDDTRLAYCIYTDETWEKHVAFAATTLCSECQWRAEQRFAVESDILEESTFMPSAMTD